jgi:hypothetical protein
MIYEPYASDPSVARDCTDFLNWVDIDYAASLWFEVGDLRNVFNEINAGMIAAYTNGTNDNVERIVSVTPLQFDQMTIVTEHGYIQTVWDETSVYVLRDSEPKIYNPQAGKDNARTIREISIVIGAFYEFSSVDDWRAYKNDVARTTGWRFLDANTASENGKLITMPKAVFVPLPEGK